MRNTAWIRVLLLAAVVAGIGACREYPTKSIYHNPIISSVSAFPTVIGQGDSVTVTVLATDPDGDTLVYDWSTGYELIIKGAEPGQDYLHRAAGNSCVFYRSARFSPSDSVRIWCAVADSRGGYDDQDIWILLRD